MKPIQFLPLFFLFIIFFQTNSILIERKLKDFLGQRGINVSPEKISNLDKLIFASVNPSVVYTFASLVNFELPAKTEMCSWYESYYEKFNKAITEINTQGTDQRISVLYKEVDGETGIQITHLEKGYNFTALRKNLLNNQKMLKNIIDNDKCNFYVQFKSPYYTYLCSKNEEILSANGEENDNCAKFLMEYKEVDSKRAYCIKDSRNFYLSAEESPIDVRPVTNIKDSCDSTGLWRTTQTRKNLYYFFLSSWNTYLCVKSGNIVVANSNEQKYREKLIPKFY